MNSITKPNQANLVISQSIISNKVKTKHNELLFILPRSSHIRLLFQKSRIAEYHSGICMHRKSNPNIIQFEFIYVYVCVRNCLYVGTWLWCMDLLWVVLSTGIKMQSIQPQPLSISIKPIPALTICISAAMTL